MIEKTQQRHYYYLESTDGPHRVSSRHSIEITEDTNRVDALPVATFVSIRAATTAAANGTYYTVSQRPWLTSRSGALPGQQPKKWIRGLKTEIQSEDEPSGLVQATWSFLQHVLMPTQKALAAQHTFESSVQHTYGGELGSISCLGKRVHILGRAGGSKAYFL
jgi:hypothetical protein